MNRRDVIAGAGAAIAASVASSLLSKNQGVAFAAGGNALLSELSLCIEKGKTCQAFCIEEMAKGNKEMAKCSRTINDMLAICEAMQSLVAYSSDRAKEMSAVCIKACQVCAEACEEHKSHWAHKMHLESKACHEACVALVKSLKKVYA